MSITKIDLRPICRNADKVDCLVTMREGGREQEWLHLGAVSLTERGILNARMDKGATDFEHDSAYACCLPLIGVKMEYIDSHVTILTAWINPQHEPFSPEFNVPPADYNPMEHPDTVMCDQCEEPHPIVPEGFYTPPFDEELFEAVRGKKVTIYIGPVWPEE